MKFNNNLLIFLFLPLSFVHANSSAKQLDYTLANSLFETTKTDTIKNQQNDSTKIKSKSKLDNINKTMEKVVKYSPLPVVSYSSETNWLFGLTKINTFRLGTKDQSDTTIQPSQITALAYLTLNNQYKFNVNVALMFGKNKYKSTSHFLIFDFPQFYFGIGNETKKEDVCLVQYKNLSVAQSFSYRLTKRWYIGMKYIYSNFSTVDTVENGEACNTNYTDLSANEGVLSGIGVRIARETRDNRFNAKKGSFLFFEYVNVGKWIGSDFGYNTFVFDYRKYITPLKWLTIAGQIYAEANLGDVPVQTLALMGGDSRMRGIYSGRFRDHTMIEGQVEFRFPLFWIFGGVLFTGLGEVSPDLNGYTLNGIKWTYGAGLRLTVHEETRTNLRFDVGFFQLDPLFFFTFSEAF